ncbi:MAG: hypothetical protein ACRD3P_12220 [Terriglobales bacterium]
MKKLLLFLTLGAVSAFGQSVFNGTWRVNMDSAQIKGNDKYSLMGGMYRCETCAPKIAVKADGKEHKVTGSPYEDMIKVSEPNDHSVEITTIKDGKPVGRNKKTVSEDGRTLTTEWNFVSESGKEGKGKFTSERVGDAPAGANKISGEWHANKVEDASDSVSTFTYQVTGDSLSMSDPTGDSYTARLDSKDYPYKGDPGTTSVSVKKIDDNTIEETDKRKGKVISVARMMVDMDGKTMKIHVDDKLHSTVADWTASKQ